MTGICPGGESPSKANGYMLMGYLAHIIYNIQINKKTKLCVLISVIPIPILGISITLLVFPRVPTLTGIQHSYYLHHVRYCSIFVYFNDLTVFRIILQVTVMAMFITFYSYANSWWILGVVGYKGYENIKNPSKSCRTIFIYTIITYIFTK